MFENFNNPDSPTVFLLTSLIRVTVLAVCLPCPLHTWCQSWRGQDQEGLPVHPVCCKHMCPGISPRCHLCGWWCRWTRRWCPSAFWRRCGTGSSHIWHRCGKQDCECHEYNELLFRNRIQTAPNLSIMWATKLQQIILSVRQRLAKFVQWRMAYWASLHYLTENRVWLVLNEESEEKNIQQRAFIRLFSSPFLALDIIAMCIFAAVSESVSCRVDILETCIVRRPCTWTNHTGVSHYH